MIVIKDNISGKLTRLYIAALSAVAILLIVGQILIQMFLKDSIEDSRIVNIAGRQRMLSQKLCKLLLLTEKHRNNKKYNNEAIDLINIWDKSHYGLKNGLLVFEKKIIVKNSEAVLSLFNEIEPIYLGLKKSSFQIINNVSEKGELNFKQILIDEGKYLTIMNKIVNQYDFEAEHRVDKLKNIELSLFLITLIILILEGLFVYSPAVAHINVVINNLITSESKLKNTNQQLYDSNESLLTTRQALVNAIKEKYEILIKEDKVRSAALIEGQEEERKRLALELHDGIGQMLTGLMLHTEKLLEIKPINEKQSKIQLELQNLIKDTIESTRTVAFNLRPSVLSDFGIYSAIRILVEQMSKSSGIKINFESDLTKRLPTNIETGLYRITQEALNNAIKHANAKKISVSLYSQDNQVKLVVADDGAGFSFKKNVVGSGLSNMKTRSELLGGILKVISILKKGTIIEVSISI